MRVVERGLADRGWETSIQGDANRRFALVRGRRNSVYKVIVPDDMKLSRNKFPTVIRELEESPLFPVQFLTVPGNTQGSTDYPSTAPASRTSRLTLVARDESLPCPLQPFPYIRNRTSHRTAYLLFDTTGVGALASSALNFAGAVMVGTAIGLSMTKSPPDIGSRWNTTEASTPARAATGSTIAPMVRPARRNSRAQKSAARRSPHSAAPPRPKRDVGAEPAAPRATDRRRLMRGRPPALSRPTRTTGSRCRNCPHGNADPCPRARRPSRCRTSCRACA